MWGVAAVQEESALNVHSDITAVVAAMASRRSGLEVRDRMWLKITIPNAFIGESCCCHGVRRDFFF